MKQEVLIGGIVLIGIGAFLFYIGQSNIDNAWYSFPYVEEALNRGNMIRLFGVILLITGVIVCVVGATTVEKKKKKPLNDVHCQICGKPKGFDQFYVVAKDGKHLTVCEKCADEIERKDKGNNVVVEDEVLKVLKLRYAKGEITKEQFDQMKKDLEK